MEGPPLILLKKLAQQEPVENLVAVMAVAVVHPVVQVEGLEAQGAQGVRLEAVADLVE